MQTRVLGNTGLTVSVLGFGCAPLQSRVGRAPSLRALRCALDAGISFFDTANTYGQGQSESTLGEVIRSCRERVVLCTKAGQTLSPLVGRLVPLKRIVGPLIRPFRRVRQAAGHIIAAQTKTSQYSDKALTASVEGSLGRLGTDVIDLLLLHSPSVEVIRQGDAFLTLGRLQRAGKIRAFGVSCHSYEEAHAVLECTESGVSALQISFNVLDQEAAALLEPARKLGIGIIARSPFAQGRIWTDPSASSRLHGLTDTGLTLGQAAIRWVLSHPQVVVSLPSMTTPAHIAENAAGASPAKGPIELQVSKPALFR